MEKKKSITRCLPNRSFKVTMLYCFWAEQKGAIKKKGEKEMKKGKVIYHMAKHFSMPRYNTECSNFILIYPIPQHLI